MHFYGFVLNWSVYSISSDYMRSYLVLQALICNIPWESFNTSRLSKLSMQLFSIRTAVGRLKSIKRKKRKLSALQRFPSDEAGRKSTWITAEALGEIKSCHLQYMHLPEVFSMFTYSRVDAAEKIHITFFSL